MQWGTVHADQNITTHWGGGGREPTHQGWGGGREPTHQGWERQGAYTPGWGRPVIIKTTIK